MPRVTAKQFREIQAVIGGRGAAKPRKGGGHHEQKLCEHSVVKSAHGVTLQIPMVTRNNKSDHAMPWVTANFVANQRKVIAGELWAVKSYLPLLPVRVKLIRMGPRALDKHDNLRLALSPTADAVAEFYDIADNDPRIEFVYDQKPGTPYGVQIDLRRCEP